MRQICLFLFSKPSAIMMTMHSRHNSKVSDKITYPSAERNSQPIAEAFRAQVDRSIPNLQLLEIASGTGQHAAFLSEIFPNITFHPTEISQSLLPSIRAYAADCSEGNIKPPQQVDITIPYNEWNVKYNPESFDLMFNANMMHISPWECSVGLFKNAGCLLKRNGKLFTYGPYAVDGVLKPESNVNFDKSLKSQNAEWGVRDISDLKKLAGENGIELIKIIDMPSNNKFLVWEKL